MEMLQCLESNFVSRSEASYTSHHYASHDPVLQPIESKQAPLGGLTSVSSSLPNSTSLTYGNNPSEVYLSKSTINHDQNSDYRPAFGHFTPNSRNLNSGILSKPPRKADDNHNECIPPTSPKVNGIAHTVNYNTHIVSPQAKSPKVRGNDNVSPISNPDSLSDSEVPANGTDSDSDELKVLDDDSAKHEQYKKAGYFKKYLQGYSDSRQKEGTGLKEGEKAEENEAEARNNQADGEKSLEPELAVKAELDEAIRQHALRVTQQSRDPNAPPTFPSPDSQPPTTSNPSLSTQVATPVSGALFAPGRTEYPSPHLSPVPGAGAQRPQDFQRTTYDPLSPRATAHIRQLQFYDPSLSPGASRDFEPFGTGAPRFHGPLGAAGIPLPSPFHQHTLNHLADLHTRRSRANTVPATDLFSRPRSDTFSSLPEGRRKHETEYYYCHLCSYVGTTDFHFQAHMNSHFEHQCPHCDYKSRTEGRLKRHIKDFHTEDNPTDFTGGRMMRREPGKPKLFRCRQCEFTAEDKEEYWKHARSHIKDDKCLQCPKCPFVTEYKHHLEYHLRNHFGSKPFKCNKCNYSCVNKSMLNSHMKSHTNVYQYRCADCTYATKYCHSLKLHLQKYSHKPAMVLNSDGSLSNDGLGDFDLVSKRGPPRGPRSIKRYNSPPPPGIEGMPNMLGMHPGLPGSGNPLNGMQAMMGGFWPNPGPPPHLIPVSGIPGMPLPRNAAANALGRYLAAGGPFGRPMKCRLCEFTTDNPHMLMDHTIRIHGRDNSDLFDMFNVADASRRREMALQQRKSMDEGGAPHESLEAMRRLAAQSTASNDTQMISPRSDSFGRRHSSGDEHPYRHSNSPMSQSPGSPLSARSSPPPQPYSPHQQRRNSDGNMRNDHEERERPLDLSGIQDSSSLSPPAKRPAMLEGAADDDAAMEEGINDQPRSAGSAHSEGVLSHASRDSQPGTSSRPSSPIPRKRSRKGNPFKLDAISMKLQTQHFPEHSEPEAGESPLRQIASPNGRDDLLHTSKTDNESGDVMNETPHVLSQIDFSEIQRNLSAMNGLSNDFLAKGKPDSSSKSHTTPNEESQLNSQQETQDTSTTSLYFSPSIDRRKMLDKFQRSNSRDSQTHPADDKQAPEAPQDEEKDIERKEIDVDEEVDSAATNTGKWARFTCHHCGIAFQDCLMYSIHCGYHGYKDPFKCNCCGVQTHDKVEFFLHIARAAHS